METEVRKKIGNENVRTRLLFFNGNRLMKIGGSDRYLSFTSLF